MKNAVICAALSAFSFFFSSIASANANTSRPLAPIFNNIGDGGFTADTQDAMAQKYFNQGMVFFYGFDFLESIRAFDAALKTDPHCTRCQFGLALSLGSITNAFVQGDELHRAHTILSKAKSDDPVTQGLLDALRLRYQDVANEKVDSSNKAHCAHGAIELSAKNNLAFSNALFALTQKFPDEQTVLALFAYSVLGTDKWDLYDSLMHISPYANMMVSVTERLLKQNPNHIGGIHYYIHATEWSGNAARALPYAEKLARLAPITEHLVHMPTHIYLRGGDYNRAVAQNLEAVNAYHEHEAISLEQHYALVDNYLNQHNYDFLFSSAILAGRADVAYQTADNIQKDTPLEWLNREMFFQRFYTLKLHAIAHFGEWDKLVPLEKSLEKYAYLRAMWAYTKALQALSQHDLLSFNVFVQKFQKASEETNANEKTKDAFANNLAIAKEVLFANRDRMKRNYDDAILHWHTATALQKAGGDPPEWYFSTVLGLGYTFLDAGRPSQAVATFESSLSTNIENGWALFGLAKAYAALGQVEKAKELESRFKQVWHVQSVSLPIAQGSDLFMATLSSTAP